MRVGDLVDAGLAEIRTGPFGTQLRASDYVSGGRPVLNVRNVGFGEVRSEKLEFVDEVTAGRLSGHILEEGDIVFGRKGAVERHAFIQGPFVGALQGSDCIRLRILDGAPIRPGFATFALRTPEHQSWMRSFCSHGATMASLNQDILRQIVLPDLDLRSQEGVIEILGAIDALIATNRRRIELLEQMAQVVYSEWLVRFRYPGHGHYAHVESPLGPIPKGWEVRNLFDVAEIAFGFSFKSKYFAPSGSYGVVRIRDIPAGVTLTFTDEEPPRRYRVGDGDVLIGMDGDFHLRQWTGGEAWLNQRVARLRPLGNLSARHLLLAIEKAIQEWNTAISGTTVAHLGKRHLEQIRVVVPSADVLAAATEIFTAVADQQRVLIQNSRRLGAIRDLLLPRLVTGQIDVSNLDLDALVNPVA